jgi:recombination protein RecA
VDSVAALVPKEEIDGEMGDLQVGLQARLMSKAMRKLTGFISKSRAVAVFINQVREKIGISYGNPETTTGGRALKFYSTVRMEVRKGEVLKQGTESIGAHTKVKIVKNKVAPPFKTAEFDIMYGEGVSREGCVLDMAAELDVVKKSGSWYAYKETRLGQGRDSVKELLKTDRKLYDELAEKVLAALKAQAEEAEKKAAAKKAKAVEAMNASADNAKAKA